MPQVIRATIGGADAQLGKIAASDVAHLILGLERALAQAAYVALGRQRPADTGRHAAAIERATRLTFAGIDEGSFVELLALPDGKDLVDDQDIALPIAAGGLGEAAFEQLLIALTAENDEVDQRLAGAVADLADDLGVGGRNEWVKLAADGSPAPPAVIDQTVRSRMRSITRPHDTDPDENAVVGRLMEADFEKRTARLQRPRGGSATVRFTEDLDDDIHRALRQIATFEGLVTYDPVKKAARRVDVRRVVRSEQLVLASADRSFNDHRPVADLQEEQGVRPVAAVHDLRAAGLTDEDREALAAFATE